MKGADDIRLYNVHELEINGVNDRLNSEDLFARKLHLVFEQLPPTTAYRSSISWRKSR